MHVLQNLQQVATDFQRDWRQHAPKLAVPSQYAFEGYIAWRVFAEAMDRSNESLSRTGVRRAFEQMGDFSVAGFRVRFSPQAREGANFVDIGVVSDNCRLKF
ncbi:ABC transporter substrate-binding protein [Acidovorax benzenivorans]|uniref:ABC transporter substrate-binding protein n=1 Tax=Acidovorax benzenivorans TaxID=2987520 RepID=UPI003898F57A